MLCQRESRDYFRNRSQFTTKALELVVVSLLLGLLYWQLGNTFQYIQTKLGTHHSYYYYYSYYSLSLPTTRPVLHCCNPSLTPRVYYSC